MEPRLTRFVTISGNNHDSALAMMSMQLLGFHFVRSLNDDAGTWLAHE